MCIEMILSVLALGVAVAAWLGWKPKFLQPKKKTSNSERLNRYLERERKEMSNNLGKQWDALSSRQRDGESRDAFIDRKRKEIVDMKLRHYRK